MDLFIREVVGDARSLTAVTSTIDSSGTERPLAPAAVINLASAAEASGTLQTMELRVDPHPQFVFQIDGFHIAAPGAAVIRQTLDEVGRPHRVEFLDSNDQVISTIVWTYDAARKPVRMVHTASANSFGHDLADVDFSYDERGRMIARTTRVVGQIAQVVQYRYGGEHSFPSEELLLDGTGKLIADVHYRYELDDHDNWIARWTLTSSGGVVRPTIVIRRQIHYDLGVS